MPTLNGNEIRTRAAAFVKDWADGAGRVGFLFQRYAALAGLLDGATDAR